MNSRHKIISSNLDTARKRYFQYKEVSGSFVKSLIDGLAHCLEWPRESITLKPGSALNEDGFWHYEVEMVVESADASDIYERIYLTILMREIPHHFIVKLGTDGEEFKVQKVVDHYKKVHKVPDLDCFKDFSEHVFKRINEFYYERELQRFEKRQTAIHF